MSDLTQFEGSIGFLGAGNMAAALVRGTVARGLAPSKLTLLDVVSERSQTLAREVGARAAATTGELLAASSIVVIAVKPGSVPELLQQLRPDAAGKLFLSIAAGVTTQALEAGLGGEARVVRAMPNTPALVGAGATGLAAGRFASESDLIQTKTLLSAVGIVEILPEKLLDAVTGLSGSGPAFLLLAIEALADAGVHAGLPRDVALRLAAQTVQGTGQMVLATGKHPGELKDAVTSPGGTTIAGIRELENAGFRAALIEAVLAASARARELSSAT
jgi:pyrroline-5-carboxylate reductase